MAIHGPSLSLNKIAEYIWLFVVRSIWLDAASFITFACPEKIFFESWFGVLYCGDFLIYVWLFVSGMGVDKLDLSLGVTN